MANKYLDFIEDDRLINCVANLYEKYVEANQSYTKTKFNKNKVDIFKMIFDKKFYNLSDEALIKREIARQKDRTIVNAIGEFHEKVLEGITGFENVSSGIDLKSNDDKMFIELKNKHNTVKGEDYEGIFNKLKSQIEKNKGAKAYFARILDKYSQHDVWSFTKRKKGYKDQNVFIISGDELYKLMTGKDNALFELYKKLPIVIDHYLQTISLKEELTDSAFSAFKADAKVAERSLLDEVTFSNYHYYLGFDEL